MTAHPARSPSGATPDGAGWDWMSLAVQAAGVPGRGFSPVHASADGVHVPQVAVCALSPEPESAKAARDFTQATLQGWALEELRDDVAVAVSELVTNALRHGLRRPPGFANDPSIRLGLLRRGPHVLCAVADPGDEAPAPQQPDHAAEDGRGLHVVASLSDTWGCAPVDHRGKVVWAIFSASPEEALALDFPRRAFDAR
ncbi:MAG: ATP-binding protein [Streptosporangiales bacterium]|nr:ATP-binding protein [Streptosporangiales bacterium]